MIRRLGRDAFAGATTEVALRLLGCVVCHRHKEGVSRGRIVEVEAYTNDAASHAAADKRTPRNRIMFGPPGFAYVYFTYGMHHCLNVVSESDGVAGAVLIRGLDTITTQALHDATESPPSSVAAGPGLVCRALKLGREDNGRDLASDPHFWIEAAKPKAGDQIIITTRIGIRQATDLPWRFYLLGSPGVSKRDRRAEAATRP